VANLSYKRNGNYNYNYNWLWLWLWLFQPDLVASRSAPAERAT
jgi:hypothetical protein